MEEKLGKILAFHLKSYLLGQLSKPTGLVKCDFTGARRPSTMLGVPARCTRIAKPPSTSEYLSRDPNTRRKSAQRGRMGAIERLLCVGSG